MTGPRAELNARRIGPAIVAGATGAFAAVVAGALGHGVAAALIAVAGLAAALYAARARLAIDARGVHHVGLLGDGFTIPWEHALGVAVDAVRHGAPGSTGGLQLRFRFMRRDAPPAQCTGYDRHADAVLAIFAARGLDAHDDRPTR